MPQLLLSDNGSAFNQTRRGLRSKLVTHLQSLGCRAITGRPRHPQTQGKDERVHQITQRWLRAHHPAETMAELQTRLDEHDDYYNRRRPHQSLRMRTPLAVLADSPRAIAPLPPDPAVDHAQPPVRAGSRRVGANGKISVRHVAIQLGYEHSGSTVTVVLNSDSVAIFDRRGTHIRSVILEPGHTYYSNGRPRGWNNSRQASTLT